MIRLVSGVIVKNDKVLLGLRKNTQYFNQHWSIPIGHVEKGETCQNAIQRELKEELAIDLLEFHEYCHKYDESESIEQTVFIVKTWQGEVENAEPHLCECLEWFSFTDLPKKMPPVCCKILKEIESYL